MCVCRVVHCTNTMAKMIEWPFVMRLHCRAHTCNRIFGIGSAQRAVQNTGQLNSFYSTCIFLLASLQSSAQIGYCCRRWCVCVCPVHSRIFHFSGAMLVRSCWMWQRHCRVDDQTPKIGQIKWIPCGALGDGQHQTLAYERLMRPPQYSIATILMTNLALAHRLWQTSDLQSGSRFIMIYLLWQNGLCVAWFDTNHSYARTRECVCLAEESLSELNAKLA